MSDLIAAFHAIQDVKDAHLPATTIADESIMYAAYEARQKLERLMQLLDIPIPNRHDNPQKVH